MTRFADALAARTKQNETDIEVLTALRVSASSVTLDQIDPPVASVDFNFQQALNFVIENRTSDPGSPVTGQIWLRTDL